MYKHFLITMILLSSSFCLSSNSCQRSACGWKVFRHQNRPCVFPFDEITRIRMNSFPFENNMSEYTASEIANYLLAAKDDLSKQNAHDLWERYCLLHEMSNNSKQVVHRSLSFKIATQEALTAERNKWKAFCNRMMSEVRVVVNARESAQN